MRTATRNLLVCLIAATACSKDPPSGKEAAGATPTTTAEGEAREVPGAARPSAEPPRVTPPPAEPRGSGVLFAAASDTDLQFFNAHENTVVRVAKQPIAQDLSDVSEFTWIDNSTVAYLAWPEQEQESEGPMENPVPQLFLVTQEGTRDVKLPSKRAWRVRKPGPDAEAFFSKFTLVPTKRKELWLGVCMWGYTGDNDPCIAWSYVRVVPSAKRPKTRRSAPAGLSTWAWSVPAAEDVQLELTPVVEFDDAKLTCSEASKAPVSVEDEGYARQIRWLATTPPLYLVVFHFPGEETEDYDEYRIFQGCTVEALLQDVTMEFGPEPFWLHGDPDTSDGSFVVRYGGETVGRLDAGGQDAELGYDWAAFAPN